MGVIDGQFHAVYRRGRVIIGRADIGRTELAVIDLVGRQLIVSISADFEAGKEIMGHARVEIVGLLDLDRIVRVLIGRVCGVIELADASSRDVQQLRRIEVPCVARVDSGAFVHLIHGVDAGAELTFVGIAFDLLEAEPVIQRQLVGDLPFILDVDGFIVTANKMIILKSLGRTDGITGDRIGGIDVTGYRGRRLPAYRPGHRPRKIWESPSCQVKSA